jgi:YfiH family protein
MDSFANAFSRFFPLWYNSITISHRSSVLHRHVVNSLAYYTFESLDDSGSTIHGISTRHGGVSPAPFHTLNLGRTVGDDPHHVATNLNRWHSALGLDASATVHAVQAQADGVAVVQSNHRGTRVSGVDALLTVERGLPLMMRFADCVPVLLYDPRHHAVGVIHAGWRGTVLKVVTLAVHAMFASFDTRPRDLIAAIGPSIGPCCYRIGDDVAARVQTSFQDDADELLTSRNGGIHLDLWQANAMQLRALGVNKIQVAELCTAEHTEDFYSARAENKTGRFGAIIALK